MVVTPSEWIPPADAEAMSLIRMVGDDPCLKIAAIDTFHSPWNRDAGQCSTYRAVSPIAGCAEVSPAGR